MILCRPNPLKVGKRGGMLFGERWPHPKMGLII